MNKITCTVVTWGNGTAPWYIGGKMSYPAPSGDGRIVETKSAPSERRIPHVKDSGPAVEFPNGLDGSIVTVEGRNYRMTTA